MGWLNASHFARRDVIVLEVVAVYSFNVATVAFASASYLCCLTISNTSCNDRLPIQNYSAVGLMTPLDELIHTTENGVKLVR